MARGSFVSYLRVSTQQQGSSGLGLEAQRKAVEDYLDGGEWKLVAEFVEVESGKRDDRPKLSAALALLPAHRRDAGDREARSARPQRALPLGLLKSRRPSFVCRRHAGGERADRWASWPLSRRPSAR